MSRLEDLRAELKRLEAEKALYVESTRAFKSIRDDLLAVRDTVTTGELIVKLKDAETEIERLKGKINLLRSRIFAKVHLDDVDKLGGQCFVDEEILNILRAENAMLRERLGLKDADDPEAA